MPVLVAVGIGDQVICVVGIGVGNHLVAPVDQHAGVADWYVEQPNQNVDRKISADLLDKVEFGVLQGVIDRDLGQAGTPRTFGSAAPD